MEIIYVDGSKLTIVYPFKEVEKGGGDVTITDEAGQRYTFTPDDVTASGVTDLDSLYSFLQ